MKLEIFPVYVLVVTGLLSNCAKSSSNEDTEPCTIQADSIAIASKQLTLSDAEKIMGESAALTCNTFVQRANTLEYKCTYTALSQDDRSSKTGKLYFMSEVYDAEDAAAAYAEIYQGNRKHEGLVYQVWVTRPITTVMAQIFIFPWSER
jgi:hypothetical protein